MKYSMMLNRTYLATLRNYLHTFAQVRRDIIDTSNQSLHAAKRAIFALHRGDNTVAKEKLEAANQLLVELRKRQKKYLAQLVEEGAYRAATEEYVEADLFYQWVTTGKMGQSVKDIAPELYIAGLCDVPGELYRYAIRAATKRDMKAVIAASQAANEIIEELVQFDLTSYLRTKYDQAKQAAHKLDQVVYEVSIRQQ